MSHNEFRCATDDDLRMPAFRGRPTSDFEVDPAGQVFLKQRWQHALRQIAFHLGLPSAAHGEASQILREFHSLNTNLGCNPSLPTNTLQSRYPLCDEGSELD